MYICIPHSQKTDRTIIVKASAYQSGRYWHLCCHTMILFSWVTEVYFIIRVERDLKRSCAWVVIRCRYEAGLYDTDFFKLNWSHSLRTNLRYILGHLAASASDNPVSIHPISRHLRREGSFKFNFYYFLNIALNTI